MIAAFVISSPPAFSLSNAAVISSGSELEQLIWDRVVQIDDLDRFLETTLHSEEGKVFVARKQQVKNSKTIGSEYEPDFLAFYPLSLSG